MSILPPPVTVADLLNQAIKAKMTLENSREIMLKPQTVKAAPSLSSKTVSDLCGLDQSQLNYQVSKGELPPGELVSGGRRRRFSVKEARQWARHFRVAAMRPEGGRAITISIGNFKGGVTKTSTCMSLAQGLSLRGHKVLLIDCDPQGSLTTLCGVLPHLEVKPEETLLNIIQDDDEALLSQSIRGTYWDGVDLIPATTHLFGAEFSLPAMAMKNPDFKFWDVLNVALEEVRDFYDVVLIDTAPSLSYLAINAFMASEGLIVPLPPNSLDFASAASFWDLFSDMAANFINGGRANKNFDFVRVLQARVDPDDDSVAMVQALIESAYGDILLPVQIPKTKVATGQAVKFGTVFDSEQSGQKAVKAYEQLVLEVEKLVQQSWLRQLEVLNG
jgi:chromosome partitioning protein